MRPDTVIWVILVLRVSNRLINIVVLFLLRRRHILAFIGVIIIWRSADLRLELIIRWGED